MAGILSVGTAGTGGSTPASFMKEDVAGSVAPVQFASSKARAEKVVAADGAFTA